MIGSEVPYLHVSLEELTIPRGSYDYIAINIVITGCYFDHLYRSLPLNVFIVFQYNKIMKLYQVQYDMYANLVDWM